MVDALRLEAHSGPSEALVEEDGVGDGDGVVGADVEVEARRSLGGEEVAPVPQSHGARD